MLSLIKIAIFDAVPAPAVATAQTVSQGSDISVNIILAVTILIFTILIVMLFLVQRTLIKIANASGVKIESEQKRKVRPLWKAVVENQFIMFVLVFELLFVFVYYLNISLVINVC